MIRAYAIENSKFIPVEFNPDLPYVYITFKLFLKLYMLKEHDLEAAKNELAKIVKSNRKCQIIPMKIYDDKYYLMNCFTPKKVQRVHKEYTKGTKSI